MKEAFELIKERLEEESQYSCSHCMERAISIVSEVEAEYGKDINVLCNPKTNSDRIRSMSDEELAEYLPIVSNMFCNPTDDCMKMICNRGECEKTKECSLNWLKSPTTD